jgi:pimeloyl-ACP methyl ester carboxylesterase
MIAAAAACALACTSNQAGGGNRPASEVVGAVGTPHVDDGGARDDSVPVVFVHSFAGNSGHWGAQLEHLRRSRRAIALDLRGHGQSAAPASPAGWAVDSLASDVGAVVDSLGLRRFFLVGHSMGGSAALAYAARHPERVAGLVLVGTPGRAPPEQAEQVLASLERDYDTTMETYWDRLLAGARPEVAARINEERDGLDRPASLAIIRSIFAYDPTTAIRAYPGPKLIIDTPHGEGPGALHTLAPNVPRVVVSGTSHWVQLDKPGEFNRMLDEFLKRPLTAVMR